MKIFKKFLAALVAVVMAFGIFAFAACDKDDKNDKTDGTTNGDTGNGDTGNGGGSTTKTPAELLLEAVDKASSYIELTAESTNVTNTESYTLPSLTDEKPSTTKKSESTTSIIISGKANVETGNADLTYACSENEGEEEENSLVYYFLRDWKMFSCAAEPDEETGEVEEITDFSETILYYGGELSEMVSGFISLIYGKIGGGMAAPATLAEQPSLDVGALASPALGKVNTVLVRLAVAADTLEVNNGVYSVDVIKTLNKAWTEISAVVEALDENTTVGDVLANATVKKYLSVFTELVPAQTLYNVAVESIKSLSSAMQTALSFLADIKPDEGSTTYDYLVKLISSNGVKSLLNTILQAKLGASQEIFSTTLDKAKVNDLLALAEMDVASVKAMLEALPFEISDEKLIVTIEGEKETTSITYTELKLGYTVADGKLTEQTLSVKYNQEDKEVDRYGFGVGSEMHYTYSIWEASTSAETTASLKYVDSAATLADLSKCNVVKAEEWQGYIDGETGRMLYVNVSHFSNDEYEYKESTVYLNVTAKVNEQDEVVGVYVNGDKEHPVVDGDSYTFTAEDVWVIDKNTQDAQQDDVELTVVFTITVKEDKVVVELTTEDGADVDYSNIYMDHDVTYYTSTMSKILAGKPDWTLMDE